MTTEEKLDKILSIIRPLAAVPSPFDNDDFNIYDSSGGNFDDAFSMGSDFGESSLSRQLLKAVEEQT